jgi:hypothetical protein
VKVLGVTTVEERTVPADRHANVVDPLNLIKA